LDKYIKRFPVIDPYGSFYMIWMLIYAACWFFQFLYIPVFAAFPERKYFDNYDDWMIR